MPPAPAAAPGTATSNAEAASTTATGGGSPPSGTHRSTPSGPAAVVNPLTRNVPTKLRTGGRHQREVPTSEILLTTADSDPGGGGGAFPIPVLSMATTDTWTNASVPEPHTGRVVGEAQTHTLPGPARTRR